MLTARLCTQGLTTPSASSTLVCPKLETLNLDGCTNLDWDSLRTFVEGRLPGHSFAYSRQVSRRLLPNGSVPISSASAYAKLQQGPASVNKTICLRGPKRLRSIDVTRCHQISKEMVQWLRMYVTEVKCDPAKGIWGEAVLPWSDQDESFHGWTDYPLNRFAAPTGRPLCLDHGSKDVAIINTPHKLRFASNVIIQQIVIYHDFHWIKIVVP